MTILVTGSSGKTSTRLVRLLKAASIPYLLATRRPAADFPDTPTTRLDWDDASTFTNPFNDTSSDAPITAAYLVPPESMEPAPPVNAFIDLAITKGVKKFVFLAGTSTQKGSGMYVEPIWSHLENSNVEFAILRPTWFMENFSEMQHQKSIKEESRIYTAVEDGKVPFVSVEDIAAAAFAFLSGQKTYENRDFLILGPELLSHDQIAAILSEVLDRKVEVIRKSQDEMVEQYMKVGVKPAYAMFLPILETYAKNGSEEHFNSNLEDVIGRKAITFRDWATGDAKRYF